VGLVESLPTGGQVSWVPPHWWAGQLGPSPLVGRSGGDNIPAQRFGSVVMRGKVLTPWE